jgi:GAF domain-containing protein
MPRPSSAFSTRLADLLATLESTALLGSAGARVRGLGEHLRFACLAMPCDEALVALEMEALGRLTVPAIATTSEARESALDFPASGTPFAHLLAGGTGYAASLAPNDVLLAPLRDGLTSEPRSFVLVPLRSAELVLGGALFLRSEEPFGEKELELAERLAVVLSLTVEAFRTERVLFELFARALPELVGETAPTRFADALAEHVHTLRIEPAYRRRLELALAVGRLADAGGPEAELAMRLLADVTRYVRALSGETP